MKSGLTCIAAILLGYVLGWFFNLPDTEDAAPPPTGGMTITWDDVQGGHHLLFPSPDPLGHRDTPPFDAAVLPTVSRLPDPDQPTEIYTRAEPERPEVWSH